MYYYSLRRDGSCVYGLRSPASRLTAGAATGAVYLIYVPLLQASSGRGYLGFVTGGTLDAALAADMLVAAWDQNAWNEATSPAAAAFETWAVEELLRLLRLPTEASAALCGGCTVANTIALAAARDAVLASAGWDAESDGLVGAPPIQVVVGDECHGSVLKALARPAMYCCIPTIDSATKNVYNIAEEIIV